MLKPKLLFYLTQSQKISRREQTMKKTKRILMTITLLISAVFLLNAANLPAGNVQAASKGTYRAILQAYKRNDYRKVQRLSKKLPKKANEKCARKLNAKYRKAAKKVTGKMRKWNGVENYIPGFHWYAFSDINKNGKPELIVKYGCAETDAIIWVYEYKGGKYKKAKGGVYETWYPSLYNYTSGNGLVLQERRVSEDYCEIVTLVTLNKGRIKAKSIRERYFNSPKQKTTMPCQIKIYTR